MTSIGLITLLRQATQAAREGDAKSFAQIRGSIETLDRLGEISRDELDLLQIIAAARLGDTQQSITLLRRFGALSQSQQRFLVDGLHTCPEMSHVRFRNFVLELQTMAHVARPRVSFIRSRTLSLVLGTLIIMMTSGVVAFIQFVLPKSAVINTTNILTSVVNADSRLLANSLPSSWQIALEKAALRIATSPADPSADFSALQKSFRNLHAALLAAQKSSQAQLICKSLVGSTNDTEILARLAVGVEDISKSDWMNAWTWKERPPWKCALSNEGALVWRTLLAHAPIAKWSNNLFDSKELVSPLETNTFFVSETSLQPGKTLLQVQGRATSWQLACVQVNGTWVSTDWSNDWSEYEPWITGKNAPAYPLSQFEKTLAIRINGVATWLTRYANSSMATVPTTEEASWWIAQ